MPDLVIGRLLQTITAILANSLDEVNKKRIGIELFFKRIDVIRTAFGKICKVRQTKGLHLNDHKS